MSFLFATAGSRLYIGGALAAGPDVVGTYAGQVWVEIKNVLNLGNAGDTSTLVNATTIADSRDRKLKGTRNAGSMQVVCALDATDAGQLAAIAAEATAYTYAFRVVFNDAPVGGTPSERMFVALVMSAAEQWNEANSVMAMNLTLEIDSGITRVAPAA